MPPARRSTRTVSSTGARESAAPYSRTNSHNSPSASRPSASVARPVNGKTSLRLTVKAPPSKLRQATSGSSIPSNPYADDPSESDATPAPPLRAARATRNPRTVVEPDSDEEDEDAPGEEEEDEEEEDDDVEEDEEDEEDADGDEDTEMQGNEDSEDAEGEDEEMEDDHPPPPIIRQERPNGKTKPQVTVTAPLEGPLKSVEAKEIEEEDEELSELESGEGDEGDEDEEDDDSDEDDENSRSATPDLSKLTRRQRGIFEEETPESLRALSNEAQKKKHFTDEEHAMKRAEMARRRKNLSEKRNEEEKMDTINKLLKKPAPKRRTRAEIEAAKAAELSPGAEDDEDRPDPLYVRWVHNREGSRVGMPEEWLDAPVGEQLRRAGGVMVQEVA